MIGFFINITGLFSGLSAPFSAAGQVAGSLAAQRAQQSQAMSARRAAYIAGLPVSVEKPTIIPKVKRRAP